MTELKAPPRFFANLFTLGIAHARWLTKANRRLGHRTGFLFAYFLQPFSHYGTASRFRSALQQGGTGYSVSPALCFWLTGWPFIGARSRLRKATKRYNAMVLAVQPVPLA